MSLPKRKTDLKIYKDKELVERRDELLRQIIKSDPYFPDQIQHDDLDGGMLEFCKKNFVTMVSGKQIPIIPKILTIQRWGELLTNWSFSDEYENIKVPFIAVVRKPEVVLGTNPVTIRTIPERAPFLYSIKKTWDGNQNGADVYKIPQPVSIDLTFDIVIITQTIRSLNSFNAKILTKFTSRQAYTIVKGHYIPIILDQVSDNSTINNIDSRKFHSQTYTLKMLGFLIDPEEFEVKPAINRAILITDFLTEKMSGFKRYIDKSIQIVNVTFIGNGVQTTFSTVGIIGYLFYVAINGLSQEEDVDFFHISRTSNITFSSPPIEGSIITVSYYEGKNKVFYDTNGIVLHLDRQYFTYDGSTLTFQLSHTINDITHVEINGLIDEESVGFSITGRKEITLLYEPLLGSVIGVTYFY